MKKFLLFLCIVSGDCIAQVYPQNFFSNPIDTPLVLVGTFGEIRPDHFHSGIDFSTAGKEGLPVHVSADGFVSRIKVSATGFGNVLYVSHSNGFVTVYAHLQKFSEAIEKYVRKIQYQNESFEVELFPDGTNFKVKKGSVIAYSGSSGFSGGPHLHFEIRDGKTEEPLNPLLFGFAIADTIKPEIKFVRIVPVVQEGIVVNTDTAVTFPVSKTGSGTFVVPSKSYIEVLGQIGFEFAVSDAQNKSDATLGIYTAQLKVDSSIVYSYRYNRFAFSDTRYANAHTDYAERINNNLIFERCFRLSGNHLNIYSDTIKTGYSIFTEDGAHNIEFTVSDFNGNTSLLRFQVLTYTTLYTNNYQQQPPNFHLMSPAYALTYHLKNVEVSVPAGALYENYFFTSDETAAKPGYFSRTFKLGEETVPLHLPATVSIQHENLSDSLRSKALIVSFDKNNKPIAEGGYPNEKFISAKTKHFGTFAVALDTTPPEINVLSFPSSASSKNIRIKITDDLSGIKSYRATLNDKWLLMEYDAKNNLLTADSTFPNSSKKNIFVLKVTDERGNENSFSKEIIYKK